MSSSHYSTVIADTETPHFTIAQFPCLESNYAFLLHDKETRETISIDSPCSSSIDRELKKRNWKLTHILNTHHHYDHVGGNVELKNLYNCKIYGPKTENIPGRDIALEHNDSFKVGNTQFNVLDVGGHTNGHIAYYVPSDAIAFVGDALFTLGCGKMFEGNPKQFWTSLERLRKLPDPTQIYCAHEYTLANAKFALSVESGNQDLLDRIETLKQMRNENKATVPTTIQEEKLTNPFLRGDVSDEIRKKVGVVDENEDIASVFGKIRRAKDNFRG